MQAIETRQGLPFAIIVGNEPRLTIHLRDPDFKEAFYSTALISPAGLCESFPSSWVWPDVTCVVFTRLHRWEKASIENNLTALTEATASRNSLVFYSTALISPAGLCESFPSSWVWPDVTCVVFTRLHRWEKASIENNLTALTEATASRNSLVVLHIEFESDLRYLDIKIEPQYILRL